MLVEHPRTHSEYVYHAADGLVADFRLHKSVMDPNIKLVIVEDQHAKQTS